MYCSHLCISPYLQISVECLFFNTQSLQILTLFNNGLSTFCVGTYKGNPDNKAANKLAKATVYNLIDAPSHIVSFATAKAHRRPSTKQAPSGHGVRIPLLTEAVLLR